MKSWNNGVDQNTNVDSCISSYEEKVFCAVADVYDILLSISFYSCIILWSFSDSWKSLLVPWCGNAGKFEHSLIERIHWILDVSSYSYFLCTFARTRSQHSSTTELPVICLHLDAMHFWVLHASYLKSLSDCLKPRYDYILGSAVSLYIIQPLSMILMHTN